MILAVPYVFFVPPPLFRFPSPVIMADGTIRSTLIQHWPKPRSSSSVTERLWRILIKRIMRWLGRMMGYDAARRRRRRLIWLPMVRVKAKTRFLQKVKMGSTRDSAREMEGKGKKKWKQGRFQKN